MVVISPLRGLINDQVYSLSKFGLKAQSLTLDVDIAKRDGNDYVDVLIHVKGCVDIDRI